MEALDRAVGVKAMATSLLKATAVLMAAGVPLSASAWYDIPVKASRSTMTALKQALSPDDISLLAGYLRIAADDQDPEARDAESLASQLCPRCSWTLKNDRNGSRIVVTLASDTSEGELASETMQLSQYQVRQPKKSANPVPGTARKAPQ